MEKEVVVGRFVNEARALGILGEQRFLSAERVVGAWNDLNKERRTGHSLPLLEVPTGVSIRYTEGVLREMAGDPGWYLVYDSGFSLRDNYAIVGRDINHQPCHHQGNGWCLSQKEDYWAATRGEPAYYLVKPKGLFPCDIPKKNWDWQEEQISQIGSRAFYRAPSRVVANHLVSCFLLNGGERHFKDCYHWGPEMNSAGRPVRLGFFVREGLYLSSESRGNWGSHLCVCLVRKFDT